MRYSITITTIILEWSSRGLAKLSSRAHDYPAEPSTVIWRDEHAATHLVRLSVHEGARKASGTCAAMNSNSLISDLALSSVVTTLRT